MGHVEFKPYAESVELIEKGQLDATLQSAGLGVLIGGLAAIAFAAVSETQRLSDFASQVPDGTLFSFLDLYTIGGAATAFVAGMFARDPGADWRDRLTDQALRMTPENERRLLAYDAPRAYWRAAVHSTTKPVLYAVRPRWRAQGETLIATHPDAEMVVFEDAGHALFVDEADRFNALLTDFMDRRVGAPRSLQ